MSLDPKPYQHTISTSTDTIRFGPLPKNATPDQIEKAYHQALISDAEDIARRTQGISFVKRGTAAIPEELNYAGLQGLGIKGDVLIVKVRPLTERERTRDQRNVDATHVIETNIKSGVRWKRQLKILKDLMRDNNMTVINSWTGTAIVRIGDSDYIKRPIVDTRLKRDAEKHAWVDNTTEADLQRLGAEVLEKRQDGTKWYYRISVDDAQRVATDQWGRPFMSVDDLIRSQKADANKEAEYGREPIPYPEVIPEPYRASMLAEHEKRRSQFEQDRRIE